MAKKVDFYNTQYSNFISELYSQIRSEVYDPDIGQNGWLTLFEQNEFISRFKLNDQSNLLDIACGSGEPSLRIAKITNCNVTGIDVNENAIKTANQLAVSKNLNAKAQFIKTDGSSKLPFKDATFDVITCIDAINHLPNRKNTLEEWYRILKPGGFIYFTDPIVVTGMLTKEQIETRSSIGYFLFTADGINEKLLSKTGFSLIEKTDSTKYMEEIAQAFYEARQKNAVDLLEVEGKETYEGQQNFFKTCFELARDKNLSRLSYLALKD